MAKKNLQSNKHSWLNLIILSIVLIFLSIFILKINRPVTINSKAQVTNCKCDPYQYECFNGSNAEKSYSGVASDGKMKCCFGPVDDPFYGQFATKYSYNHFETVVDTFCNTKEATTVNTGSSCQIDSCNNIGYGPSTKLIKKTILNGLTKYYRADNDIFGCSDNFSLKIEQIANYCSLSCKPATLSYGSCKGTQVWQKINENYDPTKDQVKVLGNYTDKNCTTPFSCNNIIMTLTPTPSVMIFKGKAKFSKPLKTGTLPTMAINFYGPFSPPYNSGGSIFFGIGNSVYDKRIYIINQGLGECIFKQGQGKYDSTSNSYLFEVSANLACKTKIFDHFGDYKDEKYSCQLLTYGENHILSSPLRKTSTCEVGKVIDFGTVSPN